MKTTAALQLAEPLLGPVSMSCRGPAGVDGWFTWSEDTRNRILEARDALLELGPPRLVRVGDGAYGRTHSLGSAGATRVLRRLLGPVATRLRAVPRPPRPVLLTGLLDPPLDGNLLHHALAWLRDEVARQAGDPFAALCTPLGDTGPRQGDFPLHCDLYRPSLLLNVFDQVPPDTSGATLLCPAEAFLRGLEQTSMPAEVRERVARLIAGPVAVDGYDHLFGLLYNRRHPWYGEVRAISASAPRVKLRRGEGYLLDDRRWLHGRTAPTGGVPTNRVYRLVFNSAP